MRIAALLPEQSPEAVSRFGSGLRFLRRSVPLVPSDLEAQGMRSARLPWFPGELPLPGSRGSRRQRRLAPRVVALLETFIAGCCEKADEIDD